MRDDVSKQRYQELAAMPMMGPGGVVELNCNRNSMLYLYPAGRVRGTMGLAQGAVVTEVRARAMNGRR